MKSHILRSTVLVCSLIMLTLSISYSYYNIGVTKVNDLDETTVYTGSLVIKFETSRYINNTSILPIKDENVATKADHTDFTITHDTGSTLDTYYFVSLVDVTISDNFKASNDFRWSLLLDGTEVSSGDFTSINGSQLLLTDTPILLEVGDTDSLELRIWIRETEVDQSSLYNGKFAGKVQVTAQ